MDNWILQEFHDLVQLESGSVYKIELDFAGPLGELFALELAEDYNLHATRVTPDPNEGIPAFVFRGRWQDLEEAFIFYNTPE